MWHISCISTSIPIFSRKRNCKENATVSYSFHQLLFIIASHSCKIASLRRYWYNILSLFPGLLLMFCIAKNEDHQPQKNDFTNVHQALLKQVVLRHTSPSSSHAQLSAARRDGSWGLWIFWGEQLPHNSIDIGKRLIIGFGMFHHFELHHFCQLLAAKSTCMNIHTSMDNIGNPSYVRCWQMAVVECSVAINDDFARPHSMTLVRGEPYGQSPRFMWLWIQVMILSASSTTLDNSSELMENYTIYLNVVARATVPRMQLWSWTNHWNNWCHPWTALAFSGYLCTWISWEDERHRQIPTRLAAFTKALAKQWPTVVISQRSVFFELRACNLTMDTRNHLSGLSLWDTISWNHQSSQISERSHFSN